MNESLRIATEWQRARAWMVVLRPAHWIKNLLVAAPMVFGHACPTPSLLFSLVEMMTAIEPKNIAPTKSA